MVMKPEPWGEALDEIIASGTGGTEPGVPGGGADGAPPLPALVVPTPSGRPFTQALAVELAERPWLVFAPARYEGIDRRVIDEYAERLDVYEISIGDYVLAGGEAAVLVITEAVARLLPGVLGNAESHRDDSFAPGTMADLLEGPVYTKPPQWRDRGIPEVLLSGHHGKIARWRRDEAFRRTSRNRPDLIERCDPAALDKYDRKLLAELGWEELPEASEHDQGPRFGRSGPAVEEWAAAVRPVCAPATGGPTPARPDGTPHHHRYAADDLWHQRGKQTIMSHVLDTVDAASLRSDIPTFRPGDTVNVHVRVIEGNRSRVQQFKGVVIRRQGSGVRESFTVRKVSFSVGVERTFPVHTPIVEKIEVVTRGDVRRAKLYYLRDLRGKAAKIKEKRDN